MLEENVVVDDKFVDRFWKHVDIKADNECWNWLGSTYTVGYGSVTYRGKNYGTHRISYVIKNGKIPDGLYCLHKCDNRLCVNPSHLFVGTAKDNTQDMMKKKRDGHGAVSGEMHYYSKVTEKQIFEIRQLFIGGAGYPEIADKYHISIRSIDAFLRGNTWRHLKLENLLNKNLSKLDVFEIRRLFSLGISQPYIAKMFLIAPNTVSTIVNYKSWKNI